MIKKISFIIFILFLGLLIYRLQFNFPQKEKQQNQIQNKTAIIPQKEISLPKQAPTLKKKKQNTKILAKIRPEMIENKEGFIPITVNGDLIISSVAVDGEFTVFHGDILVANLDEVNILIEKGLPLLLPKPKLWPKGIVPYTVDPYLSQKDEIQKAIELINKATNIKFVPRQSEENYVNFRQGGQHCYSKLGMQGGKQDIVLHENCRQGQILHEMLHALGFIHEHSREDRDQYLEIIWANIDEEFHAQFAKISDHFVNATALPFDYGSIMLYPPNAFSLYSNDYSMVKDDGLPYSPNQGSLSQLDVKRVNRSYPKN